MSKLQEYSQRLTLLDSGTPFVTRANIFLPADDGQEGTHSARAIEAAIALEVLAEEARAELAPGVKLELPAVEIPQEGSEFEAGRLWRADLNGDFLAAHQRNIEALEAAANSG